MRGKARGMDGKELKERRGDTREGCNADYWYLKERWTPERLYELQKMIGVAAKGAKLEGKESKKRKERSGEQGSSLMKKTKRD